MVADEGRAARAVATVFEAERDAAIRERDDAIRNKLRAERERDEARSKERRALREALEAVKERDALAALLLEALPELLGENWQESRYCRHCRSYDGHTDDCLVARIDAALAARSEK